MNTAPPDSFNLSTKSNPKRHKVSPFVSSFVITYSFLASECATNGKGERRAVVAVL